MITRKTSFLLALIFAGALSAATIVDTTTGSATCTAGSVTNAGITSCFASSGAITASISPASIFNNSLAGGVLNSDLTFGLTARASGGGSASGSGQRTVMLNLITDGTVAPGFLRLQTGGDSDGSFGGGGSASLQIDGYCGGVLPVCVNNQVISFQVGQAFSVILSASAFTGASNSDGVSSRGVILTAFRMEGPSSVQTPIRPFDAVPEPATAVLLGLGFAAGLLHRIVSRRRQAMADSQTRSQQVRIRR